MKTLVAILFLLLLALQYRLWFGNGSVQEMVRVREEARVGSAEVARMTSRNQALQAEVADLKSGLDAVEERARSDLGMVDEDETFYQFVRESDVGEGPVSDDEEALASRKLAQDRNGVGTDEEAATATADTDVDDEPVEEAVEERPVELPVARPDDVDTKITVVREPVPELPDLAPQNETAVSHTGEIVRDDNGLQ